MWLPMLRRRLLPPRRLLQQRRPLRKVPEVQNLSAECSSCSARASSLVHAGTQQLGTQNPGTQLLKALGTIRFGLGTQGKQTYKPGKRDPNVVRHLLAQHRLKHVRHLALLHLKRCTGSQLHSAAAMWELQQAVHDCMSESCSWEALLVAAQCKLASQLSGTGSLRKVPQVFHPVRCSQGTAPFRNQHRAQLSTPAGNTQMPDQDLCVMLPCRCLWLGAQAMWDLEQYESCWLRASRCALF